ncbi:MAG: PAS domain-containing sensor histidine kinase [Tindallia sp. MSAO_Bac2]|nr:MAG: PAS domain-containing sensor histidine kinase [Tindallia sp. MSAO_Bac2]
MRETASGTDKFRQLVDDLPVMICEYLPDTTLTYVNQAYCDYFNKSREELVGSSFLKLLPREAWKEARDTYLSLTPMSPMAVHLQKNIRNGICRWEEWRDRAFFDENGNAMKYQAAAIDVTERIEAEKEMKAQKERYLHIIDNMTDVIWRADLSLKTMYVTPSIDRLLDETVEEHMKKPVKEKFPSESLEILKNTLEEELQKEKDPHADPSRTRMIEVEHYHKNKGIIWISIHVSFIRDKNGVVVGIQGVSRDVTETKKIQQELEVAKMKAENAMKAKSSFLAAMSHEIRTPLNGIMGMLQLLELEGLQGEQKEILEMAKQSGNNLLQLINEVLDYSKVEAGKNKLISKRFNLKQLIKEIESTSYADIAQKRLEFRLEIAEDLPEIVKGDPIRLKQVFTNLIHNASKFTHSGGIYVKINKVMERDNIHLLKCQVEDTGIGIPEDQQKSIFDVFSQADDYIFDKYGGSGLGLTISKKIIEEMNGTIWVESIKGKGSCFYFTCELERVEV